MKIGDVPQQAEGSILAGYRRACYAQDEQGRYVVMPSRGWEVENIVNADAHAQIRATVTHAHARVRAGLASPLAYHMARAQMDTALLAAYVGLWRPRVWLHLRPWRFARLSLSLRARYADALAISVEELDRIPADLP